MRLVGWGLVILSVAIILLTFPRVLTPAPVPGLVPYFGVPFAVAYIVVEYLICGMLRSSRGAVWVTLGVGGGFLLGWLGVTIQVGDFSDGGFPHPRQIITPARHMWCGGACFGGFALGAGLIRSHV